MFFWQMIVSTYKILWYLQVNTKTPVDYYNKYLRKQIEVQQETKY